MQKHHITGLQLLTDNDIASLSFIGVFGSTFGRWSFAIRYFKRKPFREITFKRMIFI